MLENDIESVISWIAWGRSAKDINQWRKAVHSLGDDLIVVAKALSQVKLNRWYTTS